MRRYRSIGLVSGALLAFFVALALPFGQDSYTGADAAQGRIEPAVLSGFAILFTPP